MTTIAYKDGIIAADTGVTSADVRQGHVIKISRGPDGSLAGAAGTAVYADKFLRWHREGASGDPPVAKVDQQVADRGFVVSPSGDRITVYEENGTITVKAPYYALGSGQKAALGAMHAGADARQAIAAAMVHDWGTFGDISVLSRDGLIAINVGEQAVPTLKSVA